MNYAPVFIILIFSFANVLVETQIVENAQMRIPESLLECYRNQTLRNPEYRLPMTIETFIDLVRKVESFQKGTEDVATLATAMLHRFRLDGIKRDPDVQELEGVIPYAVTGKSFYKHRLILKYLVPSNNINFPNESLSQVELCTLHFMLSHSIEKSQRGDESTVCGRLQNYESARSSRIPRDVRYRRAVEEEEEKAAAVTEQYSDPNKLVEENEEKGKDDKPKLDESSEKQTEYETTILSAPSEDLPQITDSMVSLNSNESDHSLNDTGDMETEILNSTMESPDKSGKFIFDDDDDVDDVPGYNTKPRSSNLLSPRAAFNGTNSIDVGNINPRVSYTSTQSNCPVEYGVVRTKWGTVSMGTVLAGIAAGSYSQLVQVQKLVAGAYHARSLSDELSLSNVNNIYAATLVGDLAEVALSQGVTGQMTVGTAGGWNSTVYPKWYFDKVNTNNEMTDAEIRGGLDGLIMGQNIKTWTNRVSSSRGVLKLSQLLDMYYSEDGIFEEIYRACDRKNLYTSVAPTNTLQEQTNRFGVALYSQTYTTASLSEERIKEYCDNSVQRLSNYLPSLIDEVCTKTTSSSSSTSAQSPDLTRITPFVNVTIVIDARWTYSTIRNILFDLMRNLNLASFGSRVTVIDGKTGSPFLVDAIYTIDIETNFTETSYRTHESGMDIPRVLEQELKASMRGILADEDTNNVAGGRSTIILFIPVDAVSLNQNDLSIATTQVRIFRDSLPDVSFLYLAPGSRDNYRDLVEDITTDVFTYTTITDENQISSMVNPVVERIKKVPIRLTNPNCGPDWISSSYNLAEFTYSVKQYGINYHRLQPNYFFGVGSAEIKVQGVTSGTLRVCFSRRNAFPDSNSTSNSNTECQQINGVTYTYQFSNPCGGYDYIAQCPPLYISVASTSKVDSYNCGSNNFECQYPHNVQYKISNLGLGCASGVECLLGNSLLIVTSSTLIFMLKSLIVGR